MASKCYVEIYSFLEEVTSISITWSTSSISCREILLPRRSYLILNNMEHQLNLIWRYTLFSKKLPQSQLCEAPTQSHEKIYSFLEEVTSISCNVEHQFHLILLNNHMSKT
ncbi:hypothetical protein AAZX31_15G201700 [Glycine max]